MVCSVKDGGTDPASDSFEMKVGSTCSSLYEFCKEGMPVLFLGLQFQICMKIDNLNF